MLQTVALLFFVAFQTDAASVTQEDAAVVAFRGVVDKAKEAAAIAPVIIELGAKGFEKQKVEVVDSKWDVERTDSLVSPLRGSVKLDVRWLQAAACTQEELERMSRWLRRKVGPMPDYSCDRVRFTREQAEMREFTQVESREILLTFGYDGKAWSLSEMQLRLPPADPVEVTREKAQQEAKKTLLGQTLTRLYEAF